MAFLEALLARFTEYLPVFLRVSSFIMAVPIFGRGVPALGKLGLSALVTLLLLPVLPSVNLPQDLAGYVLLVVEEVAVGLGMGLVVTMIITSVYLAGQLIDVPMGFGMVNVVDPQTGMQVPIVAQFKFVLAVLVFFIIDGHHALFRVLAESFRVVPVGASVMSGAAAQAAVDAFGTMFLLALRIAMPVMGALFLTDVGLGIIARAVPQINVFFVGFPLKVALGTILLVFVLPVYVGLVAVSFGASGELIRALEGIVAALQGPP